MFFYWHFVGSPCGESVCSLDFVGPLEVCGGGLGLQHLILDVILQRQNIQAIDLIHCNRFVLLVHQHFQCCCGPIGRYYPELKKNSYKTKKKRDKITKINKTKNYLFFFLMLVFLTPCFFVIDVDSKTLTGSYFVFRIDPIRS